MTRLIASVALLVLPAAAVAQATDRLELPDEKRCLEGGGLASLLGDDTGTTLDGLDELQVVHGMNGILPALRRCGQPQRVRATVALQLDVSCGGRVDAVVVTAADGADDAVLGCVRDTLEYASFDAHDMRDGYTFGYDLRLDLPAVE